MDAASMLEVYRRDRRRLLGFLLSAGGGGGRALDLSRVDLDAVSADYALECVASGKAGRTPSVPAREPWSCVFDRRRRVYSPDGSSSDHFRRPI